MSLYRSRGSVPRIINRGTHICNEIILISISPRAIYRRPCLIRVYLIICRCMPAICGVNYNIADKKPLSPLSAPLRGGLFRFYRDILCTITESACRSARAEFAAEFATSIRHSREFRIRECPAAEFHAVDANSSLHSSWTKLFDSRTNAQSARAFARSLM